jgi:hypothetical protein
MEIFGLKTQTIWHSCTELGFGMQLFGLHRFFPSMVKLLFLLSRSEPLLFFSSGLL